MIRYFAIEWPGFLGEEWINDGMLFRILHGAGKLDNISPYKVTEIQLHCGHPISARVDKGSSHHCGECAKEAE